MRVRLTNAFWDGNQLIAAGTELDLAVPPKSAVKLDEKPMTEPELSLDPKPEGE